MAISDRASEITSIEGAANRDTIDGAAAQPTSWGCERAVRRRRARCAVLAIFALCVAHPRRSQADEPTADIPPTDGPSKPQPKPVPIVAPNAVTKISGEVPTMKVDGLSDDRADVLAKLCIDERGKVTTVKLIKAAPEIIVRLEHALSAWRYRPYTNSTGAPSPICFPVSFSVMLKPDRPKNAGVVTKKPPAKAPPAAAPQPAPKSPKKRLPRPATRPATPREPDLE